MSMYHREIKVGLKEEAGVKVKEVQKSPVRLKT